MADMPEALLREERRATKLLAGKVVARVRRHRDQEVLIEFEDGTTLFVDVRGASPLGLELSVTAGALPEEA